MLHFEILRDYKQNVPLELLEIKYKIPVHEIINILHGFVCR